VPENLDAWFILWMLFVKARARVAGMGKKERYVVCSIVFWE
jgi:hypothetical protein